MNTLIFVLLVLFGIPAVVGPILLLIHVNMSMLNPPEPPPFKPIK